MRSIKSIITIVCLTFFLNLEAQPYQVCSKVVSVNGETLKNAVGLVKGDTSLKADINGNLNIKLKKDKSILQVSCPGFRSTEIPVIRGNCPRTIYLVPDRWSGYTNVSSVIEKNEIHQAIDIDQAIKGQVSGLEVTGKSGMPGEGSVFNIRGLHSLVASNTPLILLNGMPYQGDENMSNVIKGYSRGLFTTLGISDIKKISVLNGVDAASYGSLGSNGIISIETEQAKSDNLETRISFSGQYGINFGTKRLPVLNTSQYKNYLREVGMSLYNQMTPLYADYPFLQTSSEYKGSYIFGNNTDWQNEIYKPGFVTNNVFRVEGGDEIAKYNLSVGYMTNGGNIGSTRNERYNTLLNSNIMVTRNLDIFTTLSLVYDKSNLLEQGMNNETNPLLAACFSNPLLSPYEPDKHGNLTSDYARYDLPDYNKAPTNKYENVSNALALVNTVDMRDKIYDINILLGLNYKINQYWSTSGMFNLYYRYTQENVFIPGVTSAAILPQYYGIGKNTVRRGANQAKAFYYELNSTYKRTFNDINDLTLKLGTRIITNNNESDMASGYNTANDFYKTLGYTTREGYIGGFTNQWKWHNIYMTADYVHRRLLKATVNMTADGSTVSGINAARYYLFPSSKFTFMSTGLGSMPEWINKLDLYTGLGLSGNSRFSSNYGKNYYTSTNYFMMSSIIRSNVPNTELEPEKCRNFDLGTDVSLLGNRVLISADYFRNYSYDLLVAENISSVYASDMYYSNSAEISTRGFEISTRLAPVETKNFSWTLGGNISTAKSIVESLGSEQNDLSIKYTAYNNDDAIVKLVKGESPYQFFGYKTDGIYQTSAEVSEDGFSNIYGKHYQAGDVKFVNANTANDNKDINDADKCLLGSAAPDFYGGFYTSLRYKNLSLTANFNYSIGGKAYNATRRSLESMQNLYNQSTAVLNRWRSEGQKTNMPRVAYGDPSGNNLFSDRWIEDNSYLRLGDLTLSYDIENPFHGIFRSATLWLSGRNLLTFTNYLGVDPEFAYSYDPALRGFDYGKTGHYKTVKVGFTMNF